MSLLYIIIIVVMWRREGGRGRELLGIFLGPVLCSFGIIIGMVLELLGNVGF